MAEKGRCRLVVFGKELMPNPLRLARWEEAVARWVPLIIRDAGWEIAVHFHKELEVRGNCKVFPRARKATINLWVDTPCPERTLVHELCHVVLGGLGCRLEAISHDLPEAVERVWSEVVNGEVEEAAVRVAAAVLAVGEEVRGG